MDDVLLWRKAVGPLAANCYIVACPRTRVAAVVDPGAPDPWIEETVRAQALRVERILLTHGHGDHIGGVQWVRGWSGAPVACHRGDVPLLRDPQLNGSAWFGSPVSLPDPEHLLEEGGRVVLGEVHLEVLHTPGHTPGGVCFRGPGLVLAGDTLFAGSIGRTDLPGGDYATLVRSIREKLFILPPDTVVYPGHGPETTIEDEKKYNPFVGLE